VVFARQADKLAEHRAGRDKLYGFFADPIMHPAKARPNPALVNQPLSKKLSG
jgi:aspartyl-tRNA(Asn)/glutamyl-tRNA(Gln) amidotransferase subunit B